MNNENRNCNCGCNNGHTMNNNSNMMLENNDYPNTTTASASFGNQMQNGNCCMQKGNPPRVPVYSYEFTNIEPEETSPEEEMTREEMLNQIRSLDFAVVELAEYLDTHPNDRKAICLHKQYCNELNDIKDKYQRVFGPLSIYCPCNKWRWLEEPWPWERSDFNVDL